PSSTERATYVLGHPCGVYDLPALSFTTGTMHSRRHRMRASACDSYWCLSLLPKVIGGLVPVHDVPPGIDVVGAAVLVEQVVGVLPDVEAEDGRAALHHRVVLVGEGAELE